MDNYKISIIIPIFKVSNFIERCVCSLFEQTLQDVEYIFVDDASPDDSIEILKSCIERYPERKGQVTILTHEQNKGLPAARNTGLAVATGEYVFHCDSDDFVEKDMLEDMYNAAEATDADMVYCDFYLSFEKNERYMSNPAYETAEDMFKLGLLGGNMKYNVWNKLVRRSLYVDNGITFPAGHAMGLRQRKTNPNLFRVCLLFCLSNRGIWTKSFVVKRRSIRRKCEGAIH